MSEKRRHRCAIYTRKSHEEGLDQAFNSLDAQRESCEAYILSQAGLGWELSEQHYDDGGISGGHMERDGLKALLADIQQGRVDVVVVYKVDRLTRSITDFGKLVEVFDGHEVSFVSVTQAFNTTNSMGRLTLNVLLSFAQFEREVTAERIRDKIAGSKQKGMWMGGRVPYGYRNEDKQLFIDESEADTVRLIFEQYGEFKNARLVKEKLDRKGIVTRKRINKSGKVTGGSSFSRGNVTSILSNPIYAGKIKHKDKVYQGNHQPIIEETQWEEAQNRSSENTADRTTKANTTSPGLLNGLLFDGEDNRLVTHYANKKGQKYHYYVSKPEVNETAKTSLRLPMQMIEGLVRDILVDVLISEQEILDCLDLKNLSTEQVSAIIVSSNTLAGEIEQADHSELKASYRQLIKGIVIQQEEIIMELDPIQLGEKLNTDLPSETPIEIHKPISIRKRGQEKKLVIGGLAARSAKVDQSLIKLIAKAHLLKTNLQSGAAQSIKEWAKDYNVDHADAKNLVPLSYLAPSIIKDIMAGHQPADLTSRMLKSAAFNLPVIWSEQRKMLGFEV